MADKPIRKTPTGNMDKDSDVRYVGKGDRSGDYIDARNIQIAGDGGGSMGDMTPPLGNEFAFSLGSVSAQNKKYRVTVDGDSSKSHAIKFLSTKRDARLTTGTAPDGSIEFNGTVASLTAAFTATALSGLFTVTTSGNEVEFELTNGYDYYQWYLDNTGTDDVSIVCIQEAVPTNLAGPLKDIGSYDLLGDLFIFSTSQDNLPTKTDLNVLGVGLGGPLTLVSFTTPHGITQGEWIRITNSNAPWLNGLFVVHSIVSPTDINIITDAAWGATHTAPVGGFGNETITVNPTGIGEIGVALKEENEDTWEYIRLLRSVELNFVSKYAIDCDAEKDSVRVSIYFDDDINTFRKFYYLGKYENDGALNHVNGSNLYTFGSITKQMYGFMEKPRVVIDFETQIQSGGQLPASNIRYFIVLKDRFNNLTSPSDLSPFVITYKDKIDGLAIGEQEGELTAKINVLKVSGIDSSIYSEIALGSYTVIGGVQSATLSEFTDVTGSSMLMRHTGSEPTTVYDIGLLIARTEDSYKYAKNIRIIDGRLVRSNLRKAEYNDLIDWFKTFKHRICVSRIHETFPFPKGIEGEYKAPVNGFYKMGYMYNETYRISGRAFMKDGSVTDWYWIDDIRIDPFLTNQANPNDNRRDQTGPNISVSFDLTEENTSSNDDYSSKWVLVPYIDLFGMSFSHTLGGRSIYEVVDRIEIGRAEVIPEVKFTGIGILSVKINTAPFVSPPVAGDSLSVGGVQRGVPLVGSYRNVEQIYPEVALGLGVRDGDRDSVSTETYHEYMWASLGPFIRMQGLSNYPSGVLAENYLQGPTNNTTHLAANGFPAETNLPPIFEYPPNTGTEFYSGAFVEVEETTGPVDNGPSRKTLTSERRYLSIYSPDVIMGHSLGDSVSLIDFGETLLGNGAPPSNPIIIPTRPFFQRWWQGGGVHGAPDSISIHLPSSVTRLHAENLGNTYSEYEVDRVQNIEDGERYDFDGNVGFRKAYDCYSYGKNGATGGYQKKGWEGLFKMKGGPVYFIENNGDGITPLLKNPDYGIRYIQGFSKLENKYGSIENTEYYTTNSRLDINSLDSFEDLPKGKLEVFGGDTFTQQSAIKTRYQDVSVNPASTDPKAWDGSWGNVVALGSGMTMFPDLGPGFGHGFIFYSQNRVNSQMRHTTDDQYVFFRDAWVNNNMGMWAFDFRKLDADTYSMAYTPGNKGITQVSGNFILETYRDDLPQRIHWSERKIYGEIVDQFINFPPFNIKDLDLKFGEIHHHSIINGELFTLQSRKYQLQYFNARGTLQASSTSVDILLGSGDVLSRDGQTLSSYGTEHKWSAIKGFNDNGKDVLYWFNVENGVVMRFGEDGTRVISSRGMKSFFSNYTKWLKGKDEHAYEEGIRGVWDDNRKEAIWTVTAWRNIKQNWRNSALVEVGEVVTNTNAPFDTYEEFPRMFRCKQAHTSAPYSEPAIGSEWEEYWEQILYTDFNYYSIFTVCFNEITNGFRCFYGHIPKTYLKWGKTFLSSHPVHRNLLFEHRRGLPTTWYGVDTFLTGTIAPKVEDSHVEIVLNDLPEQSVRGVAVRYLSEEVPDRVDYRTEKHHTWDEEAQFRNIDDQWVAPIRNDATATGDPTRRGGMLSGDYLRVKFTIFGGTYNLLHSIVVKVRDRIRRINR